MLVRINSFAHWHTTPSWHPFCSCACSWLLLIAFPHCCSSLILVLCSAWTHSRWKSHTSLLSHMSLLSWRLPNRSPSMRSTMMHMQSSALAAVAHCLSASAHLLIACPHRPLILMSCMPYLLRSLILTSRMALFLHCRVMMLHFQLWGTITHT